MIYAINYANAKFRKAQRLNTKTAYMYGADRVIEYKGADLSKEFREKNKKILEYEKGDGYWLWKPYIINKSLEKIKEGDYLIYADSGAAYVNRIKLLTAVMEKEKTDIMLFEIKSLEKCHTKRDVFVILDCDREEYAISKQRCATFLVLKKSEQSSRFIKEWLEKAQDERLITDAPNVMGKANYDEFISHRHDQSILSLLSKKYHIEPFRDASQYGNAMHSDKNILKKSSYPQIFDSHRNPDISPYWIVYRFKLDKKLNIIKAKVLGFFVRLKRALLRR